MTRLEDIRQRLRGFRPIPQAETLEHPCMSDVGLLSGCTNDPTVRCPRCGVRLCSHCAIVVPACPHSPRHSRVAQR